MTVCSVPLSGRSYRLLVPLCSERRLRWRPAAAYAGLYRPAEPRDPRYTLYIRIPRGDLHGGLRALGCPGALSSENRIAPVQFRVPQILPIAFDEI